MYQNLHFINIKEFYLYYIFEIIYTKLHFLTVILVLYFFLFGVMATLQWTQ